MTAIWEDTVLVESDKTIVIDGDYYFPASSIKAENFSPSDTTCHWKDAASYYHVRVAAKPNEDAAWCYPEPKKRASGSRVAWHSGAVSKRPNNLPCLCCA